MILHNANCLDVMRAMPDNSVDSICTDPPYGISFMGKKWDYDVPSVEIWAECLRVLKPGGHLLAFAGTRTQHRMAVRIEDAGFEIRDMIAWVYGSGFPKSLDVSKAIDKAAGVEREKALLVGYHEKDSAVPATPEAQQWQGWGTALKPALEPITVARKPLMGTVAANVLAWGCGAVNVDGCRVRDGSETEREKPAYEANHCNAVYGAGMGGGAWENIAGRWPANLIHDGGEEVTGLLGDAARFFYCPKASKRDRDDGLEHVEAVHRPNGNKWTDQDYRVTRGERPASAESGPRKNTHPTVKPTDLMCYLCRLVTPPGGVVLDPFMGSGSTGKAAVLEGFNFIGCELSPEYYAIAKARIDALLPEWLR